MIVFEVTTILSRTSQGHEFATSVYPRKVLSKDELKQVILEQRPLIASTCLPVADKVWADQEPFVAIITVAEHGKKAKYLFCVCGDLTKLEPVKELLQRLLMVKDSGPPA